MDSTLQEASDWQISDAFRVAGTLWGAEQAEGDDDGVATVEKIVVLLRDFKTHEEQEGDTDGECCCVGPCCC